jgi:hypothetical protein
MSFVGDAVLCCVELLHADACRLQASQLSFGQIVDRETERERERERALGRMIDR